MLRAQETEVTVDLEETQVTVTEGMEATAVPTEDMAGMGAMVKRGATAGMADLGLMAAATVGMAGVPMGTGTVATGVTAARRQTEMVGKVGMVALIKETEVVETGARAGIR